MTARRGRAPMVEPIRAAIVGAGIGAEHLRGYLALPSRFRVATVCDLDAARAATLAKVADAGCVTDMDAVLADPEIALVDICLPPRLHADATIAALEAGKHVVCEKPLASSLAETDRIAAAAKKSGRRVFPVFQYRYGRGAEQLRALIDAGLAGRPFVATFETHWNRGADYYATSWRGTWAGELGGAILTHAIHIHDWAEFVLGRASSVHAELATRVNPIETEDCAALAIRMECGALATSSATLGAADDSSRLRFCFEKLTAESGRTPYAPADGVWTFAARAPAEQAAVDAALASVTERPAGFVGFLQATADALTGDPGRATTLEDGRRSIGFATAAYASARIGQPVKLPLEQEHPMYRGWESAMNDAERSEWNGEYGV